MERIGELSKGRLLAVNGVTKRRHRITSLRDSLGDDGMGDHESNVLQNKSNDWNRGLRKKRKKSRYETGKNSWEEGYLLEEGDDDRRINRKFAAPLIQTVDEMVIGVSIPRRIRSASRKRLNTNWSFRDAGFGGGLSHHRRFSPSEVAVGRRVTRASSPNALLRENKKSLGSKSKLPEAVGDTSLVEDDEIEVVEALFDLMNQTHSELDWSKKDEMVQVCTSESNKEPVSVKKSIKTSHLPLKSGFLSKGGGLGKKGVGLPLLNDDLIAKDDSNLPQSTVDMSVGKEKVFNKRGEVVFNDLKRISTKKRVVAPQDEEFPLHENQNSDKQVDSMLLEGNPAANSTETKREAQFQTDLMVEVPDEVVEKDQDNKLVKSYLGQGSSKLEQNASHRSGVSELVESMEELNQCKALISGGHKFALRNSLPSPSLGTGWPRGLPHPRFVPPFQIVTPDRNALPFTTLPVFMQHPPYSPLQPRRKRCATHQYIAHNILYHQRLVKNLTTLPATACPSPIYTSKAPMPDALISKQNKTDGDEFQGKFMGKTRFSSFGGDKTFDTGNSVNVSNNKQHTFQQAPQQTTTANILGPGLVVRLGQHQALMVPPTNQNAAALLSDSVKGALGSSSSSPVVSHDHINHLSKTIPPYMTILQNNGNPSPFFNTNTGEKVASMPNINGSYYSPPCLYGSQTQRQKSLS